MSDINHPDSQQAAANAKLRGFISESAEQRHSMDALKRANIEINKLRQQVAELEKQNALIDDECDKVWEVLRTYNPQDIELEYIGFKTIETGEL